MSSVAPEELHRQVVEVLASVLEIPTTDTSIVRAETPQWDSLRHIELVLFLEETFEVRFSPDDVTELVSSEAIATTIAAKQG